MAEELNRGQVPTMVVDLWSSVGPDSRGSGSLCASLERSEFTTGGAIILGATHHKFRIGRRDPVRLQSRAEI